MPLIVPVLPTPAAALSEAPTAAAAATSQSEAPPRFSDALSRAGQSQSAQSRAGGGAPSGANLQSPAQKPATGGAVDTKAQARANDPQHPTLDAAAGNTAAAFALQTAGALQAATSHAESGKNLPHDSSKADATQTPPAAPGLTPGMMVNLPLAAQPAPEAAKTSAAGTPPPATALVSLSSQQDAAPQSALPKSAQQGARSGDAQAFDAKLPAWLQGATERGADAEPSGRFGALHPALSSTADVAALSTAQASRAEPAASAAPSASTPGQMAQSIALTLPQTPQTPQTAMAAAVHTPVGSPDWGQAMSQQVLFAAQGQQQFATLHLNPPQLGPLEVHLQLHDGQIQAQFVSQHAVVRQAVEAALPQLRDLFTGAGLSLMQTSVGTQGGQGERQQQTRAQRGASGLSAIGRAGAEPSGASSALPPRWQQGMVNTYV
jgi:flagellar hook-length control protein FliK